MESLGSGAAVLDLLFQIGSYRSMLFDFGADVSAWTFEFYIKKNKGDRLKTLSLTLGSGLSFPVYTSDQIRVVFSSSDTSIQEGQYYWELRRTDIALPLVNGFAYFSFDAPQGTVDDTTLGLTVGDQTISLIISSTVTKSQVGLGNVDNTSDADKPISTAQAQALALKADALTMTNLLALKAPIISPTFTGTPLTSSPSIDTDTQQIASTDFVRNITHYVRPEYFGAAGDGSTNDQAAIQNAVNSGYPVFFANNNYRVNTTVTIPSNAFLFGFGTGSIISTTSNISIFTIQGKNIQIQNLAFVGNDSGAAQRGINLTGNSGLTLDYTSNHITNCYFKDLNHAGIYITLIVGTTGSTHQGGIYALNCYAESCGIGFLCDTRGEYNTFSNCVAYACTTGFRIVGGNNVWVGGHITDCTTGIILATGTNDAHGIVSSCLLNHNTTAITGTNIVNGFKFMNLSMWTTGSLNFSNCTDIRFENCEFSSTVITSTNNTRFEIINPVFRSSPTWAVTGTLTLRRTGDVVAKTAANNSVLVHDTSNTFTNTGAAGTVNFTLPTPIIGLEYTFYIDVPLTLTVTAASSTTIRLAGSVSVSAGNVTSNTVGNTITVRAISATQWVVVAHEGTWTVN
jgi:hypothetical protein